MKSYNRQVDTHIKAYMIVSYGNDSDQDYIGGDPPIKIFLDKKKAESYCKKLQKEYDLDDKDNPYEFQVKLVEIIE